MRTSKLIALLLVFACCCCCGTWAASPDLPNWNSSDSRHGRVAFQTDLDLFAPLGAGTGNAAEWFAAFAPEGPRAAETDAAMKLAWENARVLPPDHPVLIEAEHWVDQSVMRFYPNVWPLEGPGTRNPPLGFSLVLAHSWVARGDANPGFEGALEDYRRAVRLGRLLRQEDAIVLTDLAGLSVIGLATKAIFERAQAEGDIETALLASMIYSEVAPQRMLSSGYLSCTEPCVGVSTPDRRFLLYELMRPWDRDRRDAQRTRLRRLADSDDWYLRTAARRLLD